MVKVFREGDKVRTDSGKVGKITGNGPYRDTYEVDIDGALRLYNSKDLNKLDGDPSD